MKSFYSGVSHTNQNLFVIFTKNASSPQHFPFGVPQVLSSKLYSAKQVLPEENASWNQTTDPKSPTLCEDQVGIWRTTDLCRHHVKLSLCMISAMCIMFLIIAYCHPVALKTCQKWWTIGRIGERGSGISVLVARHDNDDICI